jgi:hypothetical protein
MSFFRKLFGLEKPVRESDEATGLLTTVQGNEELAAVEALLRSADIPYRTVDRDAGGMTRILAGFTMYGTDVYVRPEDLETARELLTPVDVEDEDVENEEENEADA